MKPLALAICLWMLSECVLAADNPWVSLTQQDLQAIHDLLQENHPGPVDPQNSRYADWLKQGLEHANLRAQSAISFSDYVRTLRLYTNGFQDGHIGIGLELVPDETIWPGFVVAEDSNGKIISAEQDSGVTVGAQILSCDGKTIDALMAERVDPYFWNSAIPHERNSHLYRLFYQDRHDPQSRIQSCQFSSGAQKLRWRAESTHDFKNRLEALRGGSIHDPQMKKLDGLWMIKVPTLAYSNEEKVRKIRALIDDIKAHASDFRASTVVFDVRGNHGGDSGWGEELASALWGREWVDWVTGGFDNTVDWRASASNYKFMQQMLEREQEAGLAEQATYIRRVLDAMKLALDAGRPLARVEEPPKRKSTVPPKNPITGRVYFFTDGECASACLDFADVMIRLPGVVHIGLPTSADAIYIDNTYSMLPSGLAGLGYSMKVFRNRVRGNNDWYEPKVRWPGGAMTDESIVRWIKGL